MEPVKRGTVEPYAIVVTGRSIRVFVEGEGEISARVLSESWVLEDVRGNLIEATRRPVSG